VRLTATHLCTDFITATGRGPVDPIVRRRTEVQRGALDPSPISETPTPLRMKSCALRRRMSEAPLCDTLRVRVASRDAFALEFADTKHRGASPCPARRTTTP
jgi:hypothetical protein